MILVAMRSAMSAMSAGNNRSAGRSARPGRGRQFVVYLLFELFNLNGHQPRPPLLLAGLMEDCRD
jgi:hypothetical protein